MAVPTFGSLHLYVRADDIRRTSLQKTPHIVGQFILGTYKTHGEIL